MATIEQTTKKTTNIADLMKRPEIQKKYMDNKSRLSTDDIVDMLIHIKYAEFKTEKSMKNNEDVEFMYLHFVLDGDKNEKYIKTQSTGLTSVIKAIPPEVFKSEDVVCMIVCKRQGTNKYFTFSGL